ncbi:ionotropic receptor 21a-like [Homarus americanus]|uniref:ionotropic receptor 21a-like n=1 Tax=Homarus americanus TaxID=6706 RepID=UPI001C47473C|nr:ionotropic receptor 21a-like [Homarus americanus]
MRVGPDGVLLLLVVVTQSSSVVMFSDLQQETPPDHIPDNTTLSIYHNLDHIPDNTTLPIYHNLDHIPDNTTLPIYHNLHPEVLPTPPHNKFISSLTYHNPKQDFPHKSNHNNNHPSSTTHEHTEKLNTQELTEMKISSINLHNYTTDIFTTRRDTTSLSWLLVTVVEREMKECDMVVVYDAAYGQTGVLDELLLLPNIRQVVEVESVADLLGVVWVSAGCRGYLMLLHQPELLLVYVDQGEEHWHYHGRYFFVGLSLDQLMALTVSKKGRKTEHITGAVKAGTEGQEWKLYMNQLFWGDGLIHVTTWRGHRFSSQQVSLYPDKLTDLRGAVLKVVTFVWEPSIFYYRAEDGTVLFRYGTDIMVTEALGQALNFTIQYEEPPNGEMWGITTENGTLTGLRGKLYRDEADIGIANLYMTLNQRVGTEFSAPYDTESNCFLVRAEPPLPPWQALAFPFHPWTWLAVLVCLLLSGPVLLLVARGSAKSGEEVPSLQTLSDCYTNTFGMHLRVTAVHLPHRASTRVLVSFLWVYTIILTIAYCTNLTAYMLVSKQPRTINTIKELHDSGLKVFGLGDLFKRELSAASDPYLQGLSKTFQVHSSPLEIFPNVLAGRGALLENEGHLLFSATTRFTSRGTSRVRIMKECFAPYNIALGLQSNSAIKRRLDHVIGWLQQAGLVRRFFSDGLRLAASTEEYGGGAEEGEEVTGPRGVIPLSLDHLQGIFLVIIGGWLCSGLVFILEKCLLPYRK